MIILHGPQLLSKRWDKPFAHRSISKLLVKRCRHSRTAGMAEPIRSGAEG